MAGVMAISRDRVSNRINSIKCGGAGEVAAKLDQLRRLRREFLRAGSELGVEFLSSVIGLLSDPSSPVRKCITTMIGEIGVKELELLPEIIPVLMEVLNDETSAVSRQAVLCGIDIFRSCFNKVAIQGLHSSEISEVLKLSWESVLKLKDELCSIAFGVGSDGRRLCALKFVESLVLLYTSDPEGALEPTSDQISEANFGDFDISWLRGGHPILNVSDLSNEASQALSRLLDLLRAPYLKSNSILMFIFLIKSISIIARKRPAFYGRILPVLLAFKPSVAASEPLHVAGLHHALKNAFESCLDCAHHAAAPWRNRLVSALSDNKVGTLIDQPTTGMFDTTEKTEPWDDAPAAQTHEDEKPSASLSPLHGNAGKKRLSSEFVEDDNSKKRARSLLSPSEGPGNGMSEEPKKNPECETSASQSIEDSGPVQQLVAMFAALVAQGDKAVASLEILINSISADLLAEVVMANMQNLPPRIFETEESKALPLNVEADADVVQRGAHIKHLSMLLADILPQAMPIQESGMEQPRNSVPAVFEQAHVEDEPELTLKDSIAAFDSMDFSIQQVTEPLSESSSFIEAGHFSAEVEANEVGSNGIPGLALSIENEKVLELVSNATDLIDGSEEDNQIFGRKPADIVHFLEKSEELSSKPALVDSANINLPTTSDGYVSRLVLPKMSAPVICLGDEQKDQLQQLAFVHIIDAKRHISIAGGSEDRLSILAHSGMEFPTELDPWKLLREHILSDYSNHEGHELTLRVLYRLYREAEADRDFFSSTAATSAYEFFLLQVAETLRDSLPASDKSLGRLLCDVPYLPKSIFEMLESLSSPGRGNNDDKELYGGDRVTQGLSVVWSLIMQRPPIRDSCLQIALKSAVHCLEEVRMKAIRLVANKLYPLSSISGKIEDFAVEKMLSCISDNRIGLHTDADEIRTQPQQEKSPFVDVKDTPPDSHQLTASESTPSYALAEVQHYMSLYFALCTKKHSLFRKVFEVYKDTSIVAKQAIHQQIPLLVRTIGSSHDLLNILSDPPTGSEGLVIQVVQTLTEGIHPSSEFLFTIKKLYHEKLKDLEILIPILPFLPKDEILALFPHLVSSPLDKFQTALSRVVQVAPVLTPAEALIAIHGIDPEREGIPLKKVTDACNACFEQRHIFSQQVLAKVLNQLVEQIPLPLLFMRTVLQAVGAFPSLVEFIMELLSRLVSKQIWKYPKLWVGFLKCAQLTKPQSFSVLLQLPTAQLENALLKIPSVKDSLVAHAAQPLVRSSLPRSTLVVLGLEPQVPTETAAPEIQIVADTPTQAESETVSEAQTQEAGDSETAAVTDNVEQLSSSMQQ